MSMPGYGHARETKAVAVVVLPRPPQNARMPTLLDARDRALVISRIEGLAPDSPALWGRMSAPEMIAHLSDQMRIALGDLATAPQRGPLRLPLLKQLVMYWAPWPKGRIKGPPEAFTTRPATWQDDIALLKQLLERFVREPSRASCPDHPTFGRMTHESWGRFSHRHFDHHLRQFGV